MASTTRRAALLKLATNAYESQLDVMSGLLQRDDQGRWRIGRHDLTAWLEQHGNEEVTFVLGSAESDAAPEVRTCRTCGRDYTDIECPYCRANRLRLRGH